MIKRIRLLGPASPAADPVAALAATPPDARPTRIAGGPILPIERFLLAGAPTQDAGPGSSGGSAPAGAAGQAGDAAPAALAGAGFAAIEIAWFPDTARLARFEAWLAGPGAGGAAAGPAGGVVVRAEEKVLRGADWLERRWRSGGVKYKHVALARRASHLGREEFAARWQAHAGRAGGTVIPDDVRGNAYVQNHPLDEGPYDAVNEVYFDDEAGLSRRIAWFAAHPPRPDDLFGPSLFLAVEERQAVPADFA